VVIPKSGKWLVSGDFQEPLTNFCFQKSHRGFPRKAEVEISTDFSRPLNIIFGGEKMAQKKTDVIPAGQTDLFDLFGLNNMPAVEAVEAAPRPLPAAPMKVSDPTLPDGWSKEDIHFLLGVLEEGPILVADTALGIPTIHSNFGTEVEHCGFGLMRVKGAGYDLSFDAGGAMQRTPSGKGWTRLYIDGTYTYDAKIVREKLLAYLPDSKSSPTPQSVPVKTPIEKQVQEFQHVLGQFTGTEKWTRYPALCPNIILLTDGALFVAEHGGEDGNTAWWLIDVIASYQGEAALKHHDFQVWKLIVHPPDEPGPAQNTVMAALQSKPGQTTQNQFNPHRHASISCTNGNEKELVRQEIDMTDFLPVGEITLYASVEKHPDISLDRQVMILLLPSEY